MDYLVVSPELSPYRFTYPPLNDAANHTRVLELLPSTDFGSPIICHLCVATGLAVYEALSYVWGDPAKTKPILVNGCTLDVTRNLKNALQYLRLKSQPRTMWIDAICINQQDDVEKTLQVQRMGAFFTNAKKVIAWLGVAQQRDVLALRTLNALSEEQSLTRRLRKTGRYSWLRGPLMYASLKRRLGASKPQQIKLLLSHVSKPLVRKQPRLSPAGTRTLEPFEHDLVDVIGAEEFRAVVRLLGRAWFKRRWVIQEVLLPDLEKIEFVLGRLDAVESSFPLHALNILSIGGVAMFRGGAVFRSLIIYSVLTPERELGIERVRPALGLFYTSQLAKAEDLVTLLHTFEETKCTDPRDIIYALLNIANDHMAKQFIPNYQMSAKDVYRKLVLAWVEQKQDLDILGRCSDAEDADNEGWPSWIPQWRFLNPMSLNVAYARYSASNYFTIIANVTLCKFEQRGDAMVVRGMMLQTIQKVGPGVNHPQEFYELGSDSVSDLQALALNTGASPEKFWHATLMLQDKSLLESELKSLIKDTKRLCNSTKKARPSSRFWSRFLIYSVFSFFVTEFSIGRFHGTARVGDKICILYGASMPVILRDRDDGSYQLIGACYVQDIMFGEAIEGFKGNVVDLPKFRIT